MNKLLLIYLAYTALVFVELVESEQYLIHVRVDPLSGEKWCQKVNIDGNLLRTISSVVTAKTYCKENFLNGRLMKFTTEDDLYQFETQLRSKIEHLGKWPIGADRVSILIGMTLNKKKWEWIDKQEVQVSDFPRLDIISKDPDHFTELENTLRYVVIDLYRKSSTLRVADESELGANTFGCEYVC